MSVPLLPGYGVNEHILKKDYRVRHHFDKKNNICYTSQSVKPCEETLNNIFPHSTIDSTRSDLSLIDRGSKPIYEFFDKKVLCFFGYSRNENSQKDLHRIKIYFYLCDDTIEIIEPRVINSGVNQGVILRRHRVPKPNGLEYFKIDDFNLGVDLEIYGKTYHITSCDKFTRDFLYKLGFNLNEEEDLPKTSDEEMTSKSVVHPQVVDEKMKRFLLYDKTILSFNCLAKDKGTGRNRHYFIRYYMSDGSMEIISKEQESMDVARKVLKRTRVPKNGFKVELGSQETNVILNVVTTKRYKGIKIGDVQNVGLKEEEYYCEKDLLIGNQINIFNTDFLIYDCNEFTRDFYRKRLSIEMKPIQVEDSEEHAYKTVEIKFPYNGFGSYEDSLANTKSIIPRPPKKDVMKFLLRDRCGQESNILNFLAKVKSEDGQVNSKMSFIISFHLSDDTISIVKTTPDGCKCPFLSRRRIPCQSDEIWPLEVPDYYSVEDFYIGSEIMINKSNFVIIETDEYTINYLIKNNVKPFSNSDEIITKVVSALVSSENKARQIINETRNDSVDEVTLTRIFEELSTLVALNPHELRVLRQILEIQPKREANIERIIGLAQMYLKKSWFDDFKELKETFLLNDTDKMGAISIEAARKIFKANRIKMPNDFLDFMLKTIGERHPENLIPNSFPDQLNWRENHVGVSNLPNFTDIEWFNYVHQIVPNERKLYSIERIASNFEKN